VLSGAAYGPDVDNVRGAPGSSPASAPRVGHFFLALDVARFMPLAEFRRRLADLFRTLKESRKALDKSVIYIHGEKEQVRARLHEQSGIPVAENVLAALRKIATESGVAPPVTMGDRLRRNVLDGEEGR
jgi:LDH2 family malate/lactate/ureidoglycolate dehydrogenase